MKTQIQTILKDNDFKSDLFDEDQYRKLIIGGGGQNQRELQFRNLIHKHLIRLYPDENYQREKSYRDLINHQNDIAEFSHNMLLQPESFTEKKINRDYSKRTRQFHFKNYYSVHYLTDFIILNLNNHPVGKSYHAGINRLQNKQEIKIKKLDRLKAFVVKKDKAYHYSKISGKILDGSKIDFHIFITKLK